MLLFAYWMTLTAIAFLIGWARGYKEGKEESQLRILKMRRAINANRQG